MPPAEPRVGYVIKVFPRLSETFILTELLAHQAAGLDFEVFSLRPADGLAAHRSLLTLQAPVTYLPTDLVLDDFWRDLEQTKGEFPHLLASLAGEQMRGLDFLDLYQAMQVARAVRDNGITHLHAHFATSPATVARLASRITGIPYSFTAHAKDIFHDSVDGDDLARKLTDAAFVVAISDYNRRYLEACGVTPRHNLLKIYNGLDLRQFPYAAPVARPPRILAVGRLIEKKGFADVVEACALLAKAGREFTCDLIGPGPLEADLRERVARLGLAGRVRLLGPLPQEQVIDHIRGSAVFAAPCVTGSDGNVDGLPTVLLEAMAIGTPCVSTAVTGIPEAVIHGVTGIIVPEHAPHELAAAICRLFDDSTLGMQLSGQARRLVESRFDIHHNTAKLRVLFSSTRAGAVQSSEQVA